MICRLCLLESLNYIEIFGKKGCEMKIASLIAEHFWFTLKEDDCTSKMICSSCWHKTKDFHEFYLNIKDAQERLSTQTTCEPAVPEIVSIKMETDDDLTQDYKDDNTETTEEDVFKKEDNKILIPQIEIKEGEHVSDDQQKVDANRIAEKKLRGRKVVNILAKNMENSSRRRRASTRKVNTKLLESDDDDDYGDDIRESDDDLDTDEVYKKQLKYQERKKEDDAKIAKFMKLECNWCRFEGPTFASVKKHCRKEHKKDGFIVCCQKKFLERRQLLEHVNLHLNPEDFTCKICKRTFSYMRSFKNHMTQHSEVKPFKCDKCPKEFGNQVALNQHQVAHIPLEERQFLCDQCHRSFPSKNRLETHQKVTHGNAYSRICDICGKVIRKKTIFDEHQRQHAGIVQPKVQCPQCGRWYKDKYSVKRHINRDHLEVVTESDLTCNICGVVKPSRESLRRHKKNKHLLLDSLQCGLCQRTLNSPIALKEHMTTHTGEALYTCPYCPKTFSFNAALHLHRKNVHPTEWEESRKKRTGQSIPIESKNTKSDEPKTVGDVVE